MEILGHSYNHIGRCALTWDDVLLIYAVLLLMHDSECLA